MLEHPSPTEEHKRLLLSANSPPRTLTALDEGRVVCSLLTEEGLSPTAVARLLRRKPQWVARRVDIATHLSPTAENTLAQGKLGPTVAHALCGVPCKDQDALLSCIDCHGLKLREALALVSAYRVADKQDRRILLNAPLDLLRPEPQPSPASSPALTECEQPLESTRQALVSLAYFAIPPEIAPAEKRRFETPAGEEMQIDWSPYYVRIATVTRILYAFGCLLCSSRKLWVHFYRDERQSTLLEAIACAFEYFLG